MEAKNLLIKNLFLIPDNLINKDNPKAPSHAPKDKNIKLNKNRFFNTNIVKIVIKINSNLSSKTIKCFCNEKFKKQQKIIK